MRERKRERAPLYAKQQWENGNSGKEEREREEKQFAFIGRGEQKCFLKSLSSLSVHVDCGGGGGRGPILFQIWEIKRERWKRDKKGSEFNNFYYKLFTKEMF